MTLGRPGRRCSPAIGDPRSRHHWPAVDIRPPFRAPVLMVKVKASQMKCQRRCQWAVRFRVLIAVRARLPHDLSRAFCYLSELYQVLVFEPWLRRHNPHPSSYIFCTLVFRRCSQASVLNEEDYVNNVERRTDPQQCTSACDFPRTSFKGTYLYKNCTRFPSSS